MTIAPKNATRILNLKGPGVLINVIQAQKTYAPFLFYTMKLLQRLCIDSDNATRVWESGIVDSLIQAHKEKTFPREIIAEWFALFTKLTNSDIASASLV